MENITTFETTSAGEVLTYVLIDHGNDQFTSMLKSTYDEQEASDKAAAKALSEAKTK
jgi:hypothetical protein